MGVSSVAGKLQMLYFATSVPEYTKAFQFYLQVEAQLLLTEQL